MKSDPNVTIKMSEYRELLRLAGLNPSEHGISDLKRLIQSYCNLEADARLMRAEDPKFLRHYNYNTILGAIDAVRNRKKS